LRHPKERRVSLDGRWLFRLDPKDEGKKRGWYKSARAFKEQIAVPGCWQGQGFGHDGDDEIWDFRLRARTYRATYCGTGWYCKQFLPPEEWQGQRIWLNFGAVRPAAEVWLNGRRIGSHCAPFVPFAFDVTGLVSFTKENVLVVRVHEENRWLGLSMNWQGNWSGLYRSVELTATGDLHLERLWLYPDVDSGRLRVQAGVQGSGKSREPLRLRVSVKPLRGPLVASAEKALKRSAETRFSIAIPDPLLWSPDGPNLYRVDATLMAGKEVLDAVTERVGFVKLSTKGKHILINDEPYYMRGSGDFAINPETGSPDACRKRWRKKLSTLRDYGYNHIRCQSYVPTPEYMDAADEVGLIIQNEMGMTGAWGGHTAWHVYGWPKPTPEYYRALKWQWEHTVMRDICRPSANIYCMSNELGTSTHFPRIAKQCAKDTKALKPTAFVLWTDGGHNEDLPGEFLNAEAALDSQSSLPVIQHEFRWWSSYPDVRLKKQYDGAVRPYAIEMAEKAAAKHNMTSLLPAIARNGQRLQYLEARTKMEICRRDHPTLAGISHFSGTDCGLSPQGIVDEFYGRKHADAATWRRTWGDTVILIDKQFEDRVLVGGQALKCRFSVSDFSHPPLGKSQVLEWELAGKGTKTQRGTIRYRHQPFCTCRAGGLAIGLPRVSKPVAVTLRARLTDRGRTFENAWDFWVFPETATFPRQTALYGACRYTWLKGLSLPRVAAGGLAATGKRVLLTEVIDEALSGHIQVGGRVVLVPSEGLTRPFNPKLGLGTGRYYFLPPANYPPLEDGHSGTIVQRHPMLGDLPHEGFADLQLYRLVGESAPLDLVPFEPCGAEPVIRAISTYFVSHPLAYLAELRFGKGALIISALDLSPKRPEARYVLSSILKYAARPQVRPKAKLSNKALQCLLEAGRIP